MHKKWRENGQDGKIGKSEGGIILYFYSNIIYFFSCGIIFRMFVEVYDRLQDNFAVCTVRDACSNIAHTCINP